MWIRTPRGPGLAAELRKARGEAIVVMAHGFCDNRHSFGRFDQLADGFAAAGYDVLTFDFSGCGQSDPDVITVANEVEDLTAILGHVRELGYRRIGLYGHSLGGTISLKAYDGTPETIVLTGTPTDAINYDWRAYYGERRYQRLQDEGVLRIGPWTLTHQSLRDFEEFDQHALLSQVKCPVLLVHGGDWEERSLARISQKGMPLLPAGSRMEILEDAAHSFKDDIPRLLATAVNWYAEHMPLP
ncbi:alpha/beta hydrolase family protein [Actinocrispum wychmicini]|uniref:Serine aminopeptidase S33 family n=1 Tax=Actinocrispum wychmicini TaxID=1213861 RepID=A0A4R2JG59_9PSEU|nr:alpha/beta fold hydrolase [Actinocrispum wychmicini]TCO57262.1 serine aminopeptidase S33 family [Actinocrispum wychmicini]